MNPLHLQGIYLLLYRKCRGDGVTDTLGLAFIPISPGFYAQTGQKTV